MRIAIFASGSGTNLQSIIDSVGDGNIDAEIGMVLSNKKDSYALERARKHNIPGICISSKDFDNRGGFIGQMLGTLDEYGIDFIALAGYMKKIPPELIAKFRNRITNIHPALLPSFGGKGMYGIHVHRAVIEYGCKITGVTVHIVDEQYDHGPVIAQQCVPVENDDTPETLAEKVLAVEHSLYPAVLQLFARDKIEVDGQIVRILI